MKILCANWQAADDAELEHAHYPDIEFILQRTPAGSITPVAPAALAEADAVINYSATQFVGATPDEFAKARVAVRAGVGFDNLDLAGWGAKGVPVCNVPDYGTTEVADHAIGLLLAPESGEELRGHVGEFVDSKKAEWDEAVNEGRQAAEQARAGMVTDYDAAEGAAL